MLDGEQFSECFLSATGRHVAERGLISAGALSNDAHQNCQFSCIDCRSAREMHGDENVNGSLRTAWALLSLPVAVPKTASASPFCIRGLLFRPSYRSRV